MTPKPYKYRELPGRLCVVDIETDPFAAAQRIAPFALGFFDGVQYVDFWGEDCIARFFDFLAREYRGETLVIYAHNGGKFDFNFFLDYLDSEQEPLIVSGRIISAHFQGQQFRDSFAILPVPLKDFGGKIDIDYEKMSRARRDENRAEIMEYLRADCEVLFKAVNSFVAQFGDRLTIGGTALAQLNSMYGFSCLSERNDAAIRNFYFGGRVECFESGILDGTFKVYDVNSMYPHVMRKYKHPIDSHFTVRKGFQDGYHFANILAVSDGALPVKDGDGDGLHFPRSKKARFFQACRHEIEAGVETGTLRIIDCRSSIRFGAETDFSMFVDHFYAERMNAKKSGDKLNNIFYKLILNSAYGKFALNPRKFKRHFISDKILPPEAEGWILDSGQLKTNIWTKSIWDNKKGVFLEKAERFYNVATAASITSAARAELLRGISQATRPVYCDTDAVICEAFSGHVDSELLGAWDCEAEGDRIAIAGKKLYALMSAGTKIKQACKGARLTAEEIFQVAAGEEVEFANPVPHFKRDGSQHFVNRRIKKTAKTYA